MPCEQLYDTRLQVTNCNKTREKEAQFKAALQGTYYSGEEIRELISGKTLIELMQPRPDIRGEQRLSKDPTFSFFDPSGEVFMARGEGGFAMRSRSAWVIEGNMLCQPNSAWPCARLRRAPNGKLFRDYSEATSLENVGSFAAVTVEDGDPHAIVAEVERSHPKKSAPAANTNRPSPGIYGPSMQR